MTALRQLAKRNLSSNFCAPQRALFRSSAVYLSGKESALGQDGRAEEIDRVKNEQLQNQKQGKAKWKDELASDSESIVKADRGEVEASEDTIKTLQKETQKISKKL